MGTGGRREKRPSAEPSPADAATQLKAVWAERGDRRGGGDPYKVVSRLALVGHLMGETPLVNCKSGKDRTGQLDAEVKFLATVADQGDGRLPPVDEDMARWRAARTDFTLNTGNLEMQQLNTGLPGYRLAGGRGPRQHGRRGHEARVPRRLRLRAVLKPPPRRRQAGMRAVDLAQVGSAGQA